MSVVTVTRRERDVHRHNRRWKRPGIFGQAIDGASGGSLDYKCSQVFGVKRQRAVLFGWRMPWHESDEALRRRTFIKYQSELAPGPCVHDVWINHETNPQCDDCKEHLCSVTGDEERRMVLFTTSKGNQ